MSQRIIFVCVLLFSSVYCDKSIINTYNEYASQAINFTELSTRVRANLGNSSDAQLAALKMLDACSKFPSGFLEGNFIDLGSFDECYGIKYDDIYGKYCLGTIKLNLQAQKALKTFNRSMMHFRPQLRLAGLGGDYMGLHFAACIPSNMAASEISGLLQFSEELCYSKATEKDLSAGAIVTIVILVIFLLLVVSSTTYDIIIFYLKAEPSHEVFVAFSVLTNGRKIFRSSSNSDQLLCLNGIKALSMMWVIIGHEYTLAANGPISNFLYMIDWQSDRASMFIIGATVSVDTFFLVGGLVTVYTFLKSIDKGVKFNVPMFYVHRYLRLTPAYFITSLFHVYLLNHIADGPLWKVVDIQLVETCKTGWWSSLLYITNYVQKGTCLPQAWYLSVDMQLFILSPIILILLVKWPKIGLGALSVLIPAGCAVPFAIGYVHNLKGSMIKNKDPEAFGHYYYDQTYARFGPYIIGLLLGYFLYKIKNSKLKISLQQWQVIALWLVSLTGLVACVYGGYPLNVEQDEDIWGNSFFLAFNRSAWAVAVSGVIFLCVAGYGGPINSFLSLSVFQFLTKLSYSMYLVHYTVIMVRYSTLRNNIKFSNLSMMHAFWGDFMATLAVSLILCLVFESPVIILEKYLFGKGTSPKQKTKKPEV